MESNFFFLGKKIALCFGCYKFFIYTVMMGHNGILLISSMSLTLMVVSHNVNFKPVPCFH